jgi:aminopeptidase N
MCPATPGQPDKAPQVIPLALGLVGASGDDLDLVLEGTGPLDEPVLEIAAETQTFRFTGIEERPVPSLNRGFAAPIKLTSNLSEDDLLFLMARDTDAFNRWEAGQAYVTKRLTAAIGDVAAGKPLRHDPRLAEALRACLGDQSLEPAFLSQMLSLPSETDLATQIGKNVDPGAIHAARDHLRQYLGRALEPELRAICAAHDHTKPYDPSARDAGERSLRSGAVALLCAAAGPQLAFENLQAATNMTDTMAALSTLAVHDHELRTRALAEFYEASKDDHLLVDKWLALHAIAPFPSKIAYIRALTDHAAFSLKTPNKVRALIGTFAASNPVCFNDPGGAGYRLVADTVLALDAINPQVAARLAGAFKSWRVLEPKRRALARTEIERISKRKDLSRDTFEIVDKTLQ